MAIVRARHFSDLTAAELAAWRDRWPNFSPAELASPDTGALVVDTDTLDALQAMRADHGRPLRLTSFYRTAEHNRAVGGVPNSQHRLGKAADIALTRAGDGPLLEALAVRHGFSGIGRYPRGRGFFIHVDRRAGRPARWGQWS